MEDTADLEGIVDLEGTVDFEEGTLMVLDKVEEEQQVLLHMMDFEAAEGNCLLEGILKEVDHESELLASLDSSQSLQELIARQQ